MEKKEFVRSLLSGKGLNLIGAKIHLMNWVKQNPKLASALKIEDYEVTYEDIAPNPKSDRIAT